MGFIGSLGKIINNTVKNIGNILSDPTSLATIALMAWINPIGTLGYLASAAVYTAGMAAMNALAPSPQIPDLGGLNTNAYVSEATGRTQTIRQPAQPKRVVYGTLRVGGVITYIGTEGSKNKFLHVLVTFTGHPIHSFSSFRVDDQNVTLSGNDVVAPARYIKNGTRLVKIYTRLGNFNQAAHTTLTNVFGNFTAEFKQSGCANAHCRFEFDDEAYPNGLPNVTAVINGVTNIFDPRTSTSGFTRNSALCIRDYLTNTEYGMGLSASEIDDTSFIQAANDCEDQITLGNGATENRYETNGSFTVDRSHKQIITELLSACAGVLTYQNGKFSLKVGKEVATYHTSLNEDDFLSAIDIRTKTSIGEQYNQVKGTFTTPFNNTYLPTDYPPITSATFLAEDNGIARTLDMPAPFTTSQTMAQRLAKIALYRSRQQITITSTFSLKAFNLKAGDVVAVTFDRFGFSSKLFEVASWTLTPIATETLGVEMMLREYNNNVYAWLAADDEGIFELDDSTLPDPFSILPPSLEVSQEVQTINQKATTVIVAKVTARDLYSTTFEVDVQRQSSSGVAVTEDVISLGRSSSQRFEYADVETGDVWKVRARSRSNLGTFSTFVSDEITILGKSAISFPSTVSDLKINYQGSTAILSWTAITDQDLSHYEIRYDPATSNADIANSVVIVDKVSRPGNSVIIPSATGTFFCVAVDKYGGKSQFAASIVGQVERNLVTDGYQLFRTDTESFSATAFAGTKTDTYIFSDSGTPSLRLGTSNLFDSVSGNFDDALGRFDGGAGNVASSGTYDFANVVDLGQKQRFKILSTNVVTERINYGPYAEAQGPQFYGRASLGGTDVRIQIATTDDDPSGSPTFTAFNDVIISAAYTARAYKLRALLKSESITPDGLLHYTPAITSMAIEAHGEVSIQAEQDVASGAGAKVITFPYAFRSLTGLGIAAQNMRSGEYYDITNKSATGFTITFYDSADTAISRTFDYSASGIGRIAV